ncbi:GIY-YIG nuclease family protein [Pigmentibacter ruber]
MAGTVYVLLNDSMPGLVKIGMTENLVRRMKELYNTSVPTPFQLFYAKTVEKPEFVESKIHAALADFRVNENREYFEINPIRVQAILDLVTGEEVNVEQKNVIEDQRDLDALENQQNKRARFKFSMVNIPINSILHFDDKPEISCKVIDDSKVEFEGEILSLSKAAGQVLKRNGNSEKVNGTYYWTYNGKSLWKIRTDLESQI